MKKKNIKKALIALGGVVVGGVIGLIGLESLLEDNSYMEPAYGVPITLRTFNSQFTAYSGTLISASQIRTLLSSVISSNLTNDNHIISVISSGDGFGSEGQFSEGTSLINDLAKIARATKEDYAFSVELGYDDEGYINLITIK